MKISIYELLGLIKEHKAPEKIKYRNKIYFRGWSDYMGDEPIDEYYFDSEENSWNDEMCLKLNDEVEIIEEEKEIEKLELTITSENNMIENENAPMKDRMRLIRKLIYNNSKEINIVKNKINELIDEINKLKRDKK